MKKRYKDQQADINTNDIILALVYMCDQYLTSTGYDDDDICRHRYMVAGEQAKEVLIKLGLAKDLGDDLFELIEDKIKELI